MISAIVPVGNYIRDKDNIYNIIKSTINKDIELIIVNDSENFSTTQKNRILSIAHPNLLILNCKARNPGGARNIGLEFANGEWVTFWDSDDAPNVKEIIAIQNKLCLKDADLIVGQYGEQISPKLYKPRSTPNNLSHLLNKPGIWRILFKKDFLANQQFINCRLGEDMAYVAEALDKGPIVKFYKETIYVYNRGPDRLSNSEIIINEFEEVLKILEMKSCIKSKYQKIAYYNLLTSYLKKTNIRFFSKTLLAVLNAHKKFGLISYLNIVNSVLRKILH